MPDPSAEATSAVSLREVTAVLRYRLATVLVLTLLGGLLAGGYSLLAGPAYTANAVVTIVALPDNPLVLSSNPRPANAATESEVAQSSAVLEPAALVIGTTASDLDPDVSVSIPADSQVIVISVRREDAAAAAAAANAVAEAYLDFRSSAFRTQIEQTAQRLDTQIDELVQQQLAAQASANGNQRAAAVAEAESLAIVVSEQREQRAQLNAIPTTAGQLVGPATVPTDPAGPPLWTILVAGLAIGFVLGSVTALLQDRLDPTIGLPDLIGARFGVDVLGHVRLDRVPDPGAEDVRRVAARLASGPYRNVISPLLVAGVGTTEPGTFAARLTAALSRYVDDLVLLGPAATTRTNLAVIGAESGGSARVPRALSFGDEKTVRASDVRRAARLGSRTVIDGTSVRLASTVLTLAAASQAAVLVVREGTTRADDLRSTLHDLDSAGVRLLGVAVLLNSRHGPRRPLPGRRPAPRTQGPPPADQPAAQPSAQPVAQPSPQPQPTAQPTAQPQAQPAGRVEDDGTAATAAIAAVAARVPAMREN